MYQKSSQKNVPEIHPKSMKEMDAWTSRSPFLCSQVPLDRLMALGVPKWRHQTCQMITVSNNTRLQNLSYL